MALAALTTPVALHRGRARAAYALAVGAPFAISGLLLLLVEHLSGHRLPVIGALVVLLVLRQWHVFLVTALFHRGAAHGSVRFSPRFETLLRLWGWLATGIGMRTWAGVHRWHHATGDADDAPFSPSRPGGSLWTIARETVAAHQRAIDDPAVVERFVSDELPDDRLERFIQAEEARFFGMCGVRALTLVVLLTGVFSAFVPARVAFFAGLACFPALTGAVAFGAVWLVNGVGHLYGYRRFDTRDSSTNIVAWDLFGLGEALHNNHHARPGCACTAVAPGELDPAYPVLRLLRALGLVVHLVEPKKPAAHPGPDRLSGAP